ncbi:transglutaminase-like domain-containing protein, partial [Endozoicomonas sp. ONNA2]|uniref:transglutaminase-like domain-containing protein n=1 Tax=Endozoicomonas sp. ONNA2 TaxID=2828741 RepID=UPI0021490133
DLPLQPTSVDLQNAARAVIRGGDFSENGLHQCFKQHYRLYLMAANLSLETLPESPARALGKNLGKKELDAGLCDWFNETVSGMDRPWLIHRSHVNSLDEKRHEIRVKSDLGIDQQRTAIIKMVAQARWQASGLCLEPDESDDILTRALYRHWQHHWFDLQFGRTGVSANSVFPLTKEQDQTQNVVSQSYFREADQRMIWAWNPNAVQLWPAFWHQLRDVLNQLVDDYSEAGIGGGSTPEKYRPEARENKSWTLDRRTNYEHQKVSKSSDYQVFNTNDHSPTMYRWSAEDIYVTAEGDVKLIDINDKHLLGFEPLLPARLPGYDQAVTLAWNQTLATLNRSSDNGQYTLPSLKVNNSIVALRLEPDLPFTLIRDRYTGLHTVFIPEAEANQSIKFVYVVETREPGPCTKKARAERSTWFDARCSEGMKTVLEKLFAAIDQQPPRYPPEVQELWRTIKNAEDTKQRIRAITDYCQEFSGEAEPKIGENFFHFLVTQRQGSCIHRVPVFIAFCRYFGIPCRQINSRSHSFAEYSGDGGQTWEGVDLGGSPLLRKQGSPDFQPTREGSGSSTELKKIRELLKGTDLVQQQALAKAYGLSLEELNKALEANCALPGLNPSPADTVFNLWRRRDLTGFSMGVSMLASLETKALGSREEALIGILPSPNGTYNPLLEAVKKILSKSDKDHIIELLKSLHSTMIDRARASPHQWLHSMVRILDSDLTNPSVINLAHEVLKSGWLDPLPNYHSYIFGIGRHHDLLVRLESVDELKVDAANCLKKWYQELLSRGKNSQEWRLAYKCQQERKGDSLLVTHCYDGVSSFLKNNIVSLSLQTAWTDEPGGMPNIERMLVHNPAFPQLISGKANHRPVIILGKPDWHSTMIKKQVETLLQRKVENSPELKQLLAKINKYDAKKKQLNNALVGLEDYYFSGDRGNCETEEQEYLEKNREYSEKYQEYREKYLAIQRSYEPVLKSLEVPSNDQRTLKDLKEKFEQAIQQAFSHYLYGVTHSKGGGLTFCWVDAHIRNAKNYFRYGAHDPSSPEELYAMMSEINGNLDVEKVIKDNYLRQTHNANNALVLKSDELTKIASEFLSSVNLNSMYDSLDI